MPANAAPFPVNTAARSAGSLAATKPRIVTNTSSSGKIETKAE
jgi:hypothetical protein